MTADLSSVARESAEKSGHYPETMLGHRQLQRAYANGFTECASRLPSEDELAEGLAARLWDRDTGDVEPWEKLSPAERENVIENYDARDYAKLALSLIGEKISG